MPCAGPNYSCNSLLSVRSPLGEIYLGPPGSRKPAARPLWPLIRTYRASRELLAHRRQYRALRELEPRLLADVGIPPAQARSPTVPLRHWIGSGLRALAVRIAKDRLKHSAHELNETLLHRLSEIDPDMAREIRKLFGL